MICLYKTAGSVLVVHGIGAVANGNTARATLRNVTPPKPFMQHADGAIWGQCRGHKKSEKCDTNNVATAVSDVAYFGQAVEMQGAAKDCKVWQHDKPRRRQYLAELSNRGYECIKREYIAPIKRGAIAAGPGLEKERGRRRYSVMGFCGNLAGLLSFAGN